MRGEEIMEDEKTKKIRTAAYCRVSTTMEMQEGSYEIQTKYYTDLIRGNADMEFVGIYGDRGKSGLNTEKRPGLQSLLADCRDGKIDLILTKSVSRFARNMGDFVEMVRELRKIGVNLYFEKERCDTKDPQMDWILDTLAIIAEEESNSISQHLLESHRQHILEGRPIANASYGYYNDKERKWQINADEAVRVRRGFYLAGEGKTYSQIRDALDELEGKKLWSLWRVKYMLNNITYKGDFQSSKRVTVLPGQSIPNNGEFDCIYLKGHHDAIIPEDLFEKVQENVRSGVLLTIKPKKKGGEDNENHED